MGHLKRSISLFHMTDEERSLKTRDSPSSIGCKESRAKSFHPQQGYVPTLNAVTNNLWYCRVPISIHDDGSRSQATGPNGPAPLITAFIWHSLHIVFIA